MYLSIVATIAALSVTVLGQGNLANIPTCAQNCFGAGQIGDCSLFDIACICGSSSIKNVACCVLSSCGSSDITTTINFANTLCSGVGVTLDTTPDCGAASSSASASASASSSASVAASSSASAAASSSASASASASQSAAMTTISGSASQSTSAAATAASGAAALPTAGAGLSLGVAVIGMFAAL